MKLSPVNITFRQKQRKQQRQQQKAPFSHKKYLTKNC